MLQKVVFVDESSSDSNYSHSKALKKVPNTIGNKESQSHHSDNEESDDILISDDE